MFSDCALRPDVAELTFRSMCVLQRASFYDGSMDANVVSVAADMRRFMIYDSELMEVHQVGLLEPALGSWILRTSIKSGRLSKPFLLL